MKTLIKHTPKKAFINTLNKICVKNNVATATALDYCLQLPVVAPDGLYNPVGFDNPALRKLENSDISDFPIHREFEVTGLGIVDIRTLSLMESAIGDDATRFYLQGVYFTGDTLVATNGHIFHEFAAQDLNAATPCIVPHEAINILIDLMKETKSNHAKVEYGELVRFTIDDYTLTTKLIDAKFCSFYPDYKRCFPTDLTHKTAFEASEFQAHKKTLDTLRKQTGGRMPAVKLTNKNMSYQGVDMPLPSLELPENYCVGFNFNYLLAIPSGQLCYQMSEEIKLFLINSKHGTSIIMPMRLEE